MTSPFDTTEVRRLAEALATAGPATITAITPVVKRGAVNVQRDARQWVGTRGRATRHYRRAISFDLDPFGLAAEIGPQEGRTQKFLGRILEFGTVTSPPHPHLIPAVEAEGPRFADAVVKAATKALRKHLA
jgi:hypothetical protein